MAGDQVVPALVFDMVKHLQARSKLDENIYSMPKTVPTSHVNDNLLCIRKQTDKREPSILYKNFEDTHQYRQNMISAIL